MKIIKYPLRSEWSEIIKRPQLDISQLASTVEGVLGDVKNNGDSAVIIYEEKFDKVRLTSLAVSQQEIDEAENLVSQELKDSLVLAHVNIARFHAAQIFEGKKIETA